MKHFIYCLIACFTLSLGLVACEPKDENDPIPPENKFWDEIYHFQGAGGNEEGGNEEGGTEEGGTEEGGNEDGGNEDGGNEDGEEYLPY